MGLLALIETCNVGSVGWPLPLYQRILNRFVLNPYFLLQDFVVAEKSIRSALLREKLSAHAALLKETAPRSGWALLRRRYMTSIPGLGGWEEVAQGGVRSFSIPANPGSSLAGPAAEQVAALLRDCLGRAIEQSQPSLHESDLKLVPTSYS